MLGFARLHNLHKATRMSWQDLQETFARNVRKYREENNLTVEALADIISANYDRLHRTRELFRLNAGRIARIESDGKFSTGIIETFATAFDVEPKLLFEN
jgi:transcriptional regulator with XRE-family HTH domain